MTPDNTDPIFDKTSAYPMVDVKLCASKEFAQVPNILTGGTRKRKFALLFAMSAFPNFDKVQEPVMTPSQMDCILLDADSLEDLRVRAYKEIDGMIGQLQIALTEMKTKPKVKEDATSTQEDTARSAS